MSTMYAKVDRVNFRCEPAFGKNIILKLNVADKVKITGHQQGDRWMPCYFFNNGDKVDGFVSKNVLREGVANAKEILIKKCVDEWVKFERGKRKENEKEFSDYIKNYWLSIGYRGIDGKDRDIPWSAAFISYVIKSTGEYPGFRLSASHARYCHAAICKKIEGADYPYWGYKISDYKPNLGDMVCRWRSNKIDYNYAAGNEYYKSHCDIVVAVERGSVFTIGGNVKHSVCHTRYRVDENGFLLNLQNVYAVLKNNM